MSERIKKINNNVLKLIEIANKIKGVLNKNDRC